MNKVLLIGRLGKDPESRLAQSGTTVATFSLATKEVRGGEKATEWHRIVTFGKTADVVTQYLTKGREVALEGRLQTRSYEKDGTTRYTTEIVADRVEFLGAKGDDAFAQGAKTVGRPAAPAASAPPAKNGNGKNHASAKPPVSSGSDEAWPDDDVPF